MSLVTPRSMSPRAASAFIGHFASCSAFGTDSSASQAAPAQAQSTSTSNTGTGSTSAFQACVIARESGGNPQVMNASGHYGLYQFSASTWAAYGGNPADFGHASVAGAFDINDDVGSVNALYNRSVNALAYSSFDSETDFHLSIIGTTWQLVGAGTVDVGTLTVTPVPEPGSLFLLMPIVAVVGLHLRHQRRRT